ASHRGQENRNAQTEPITKGASTIVYVHGGPFVLGGSFGASCRRILAPTKRRAAGKLGPAIGVRFCDGVRPTPMADAMSVGSVMEIVTRESQSVINFYDPDLRDIRMFSDTELLCTSCSQNEACSKWIYEICECSSPW